MQVVQQSWLLLSMFKGQSILFYSKGLIAPCAVRKTAVRNAICRYYPAIGTAPPYLIYTINR